MEESRLTIEDFWGEKLSSVYLKYNRVFTPCYDEVLLDEIVLGFDQKSLQITPIVDSDEISVKLNDQGVKKEMKKRNPFSAYIGQQLTSTWKCVSGNDYFDVYMLAFTNLHPDILILSEGSVLKLLETKLIKQTILPKH